MAHSRLLLPPDLHHPHTGDLLPLDAKDRHRSFGGIRHQCQVALRVMDSPAGTSRSSCAMTFGGGACRSITDM